MSHHPIPDIGHETVEFTPELPALPRFVARFSDLVCTRCSRTWLVDREGNWHAGGDAADQVYDRHGDCVSYCGQPQGHRIIPRRNDNDVAHCSCNGKVAIKTMKDWDGHIQAVKKHLAELRDEVIKQRYG